MVHIKKKKNLKSSKTMILIQFILAFNYYISRSKMFFNQSIHAL